MTTKRDYYDVLGVTKDTSASDIKKAYRQQALKYHPDRNKSQDAEQKFKEINEAYEVLSDPQKRKTYDQFGHAAFDPSSGFPGFAGKTGRTGPFTYTYYSSGATPFDQFGFDFSDPFEIFESFFGTSNPFHHGPQKPHYSLKVSFLEAAKGTQKTIVHQGKTHTIKVPAGASDGTRIRYQDFDVSFNVQPHPTFKREGYDLLVDHPIPFTLAALGGTTSVPTLDGTVTIKVRPGTQPNTMVRLRGKGIKHLASQAYGDQYIRLTVTVPKNLTRDQRHLLHQLQETLS